MKKTIAAVAMIASSQAMALIGPHPTEPAPKVTTVCLEVSSYKSGNSKVMYATCDESENNKELGLALLENGCAAGQVSLVVEGNSPVHSCMPPGMVQL